MGGQAPPTSQIPCPRHKDITERTDRSQSRLELSADVRTIPLWAGMNAACPSPESGNPAADEETSLLWTNSRLYLYQSCLFERDFCLQLKQTPLQMYYSFTQREYSTFKYLLYIFTMHFLYKAVCIWGKMSMCVFLICLTLVWKCPKVCKTTDRSNPSVIYLIYSDNGPKHKLKL